MKKIRESVFETNSSSCHSLSIKSDDILLDYLIPDKEGNINIYTDGFGWAWEKYNNAYAKASYCLTGINYVDNKSKALTNLKEVIQEQTLCNNVNLFFKKANSSCYIDHQSVENGEMNNLLFDKLKLFNFIFNKNSWLFLGNDNEPTPNKFYDTEKLIYKWKLSIKDDWKILLENEYQITLNDFNTFTWEFLQFPSKRELQKALYALELKTMGFLMDKFEDLVSSNSFYSTMFDYAENIIEQAIEHKEYLLEEI